MSACATCTSCRTVPKTPNSGAGSPYVHGMLTDECSLDSTSGVHTLRVIARSRGGLCRGFLSFYRVGGSDVS